MYSALLLVFLHFVGGQFVVAIYTGGTVRLGVKGGWITCNYRARGAAVQRDQKSWTQPSNTSQVVPSHAVPLKLPWV